MELIPNTGTVDYTIFLNRYAISFTKKDIWLQSRKRSSYNKWLLFLSIIRNQIPEFLNIVLPLLEFHKVPFKLISNAHEHHYINMGLYGDDKVGKNLILYPNSTEQAVKLANELLPLTKYFKGPKVDKSIQLGPVLFACYSVLTTIDGKNRKKLTIPKRSRVPFKVNGCYKVRKTTRRFIQGHFLRIKTIRYSPKGDIYKVVDVRSPIFQKYIIKQGRLNMVDDFAGRTICDRLLWQQKVITDLSSKINTAKVITLFEEYEDIYLVLEYLKGISLESKIRRIFKERTWNNLNVITKIYLLNYYKQFLQTIDIIHKNGYIHRDIKHGNLMVTSDGTPVVLDFELAFSIPQSLPLPPYKIINAGYQAPKQPDDFQPTVQDDIYSCGGLLYFLVSGKTPDELLDPSNKIMLRKDAESFLPEKELATIILSCMQYEASRRPEIKELIMQIGELTNTVKNHPDKK